MTLPKPNAARVNAAPWTAVSADATRAVPKPPSSLEPAEITTWSALWRSAPGAHWDAVADLAVVERMLLLRRAAAEEDATAPIHNALSSLEDRLGLSPKARHAMGMAVETAKAPDVAPDRPGGDPRLHVVA